jgi:MFS transporter, SP family, general alpha glucoside:H+ symporter
MEENKVIPTDLDLKGFDLNQAETVDLIHHAQAGDAADHQLTVRQALGKYKKAVFWALILSVSLIMEGYDLVIITSFYGQTQFSQRFGVYDPGSDKYLITPAWQSGLSNSSVIGQLVGLALNAWAQDRFGNRHTMMVGMAWMVAVIFIPVFATNLSVLAFGEFMCGIPWGAFQASRKFQGQTQPCHS